MPQNHFLPDALSRGIAPSGTWQKPCACTKKTQPIPIKNKSYYRHTKAMHYLDDCYANGDRIKKQSRPPHVMSRPKNKTIKHRQIKQIIATAVLLLINCLCRMLQYSRKCRTGSFHFTAWDEHDSYNTAWQWSHPVRMGNSYRIIKTYLS